MQLLNTFLLNHKLNLTIARTNIIDNNNIKVIIVQQKDSSYKQKSLVIDICSMQRQATNINDYAIFCYIHSSDKMISYKSQIGGKYIEHNSTSIMYYKKSIIGIKIRMIYNNYLSYRHIMLEVGN